jgi:hypothetical protein
VSAEEIDETASLTVYSSISNREAEKIPDQLNGV